MENDSFLFLFLIIFNFFVAIWLTGLLKALSELSWAKIRKLDLQRRKKLIDNSKMLLDKRKSYGLIIRILVLSNLTAVSIIFYRGVQNMLTEDTSTPMALSCALLIMFLFVSITEILAEGLLAPRQWVVLGLSIPILKIFYHLFNPIVSLALLVQNRLKMLHDSQKEEDIATTEDEIISLVENDAKQQGETATLEASEREMIRGIFDLDETLVKEIMTPRVDMHALKLPSSIAEAKEMIIECGHSRIPLYEERIDEIVGLIYAKDLLDDKKIKNLTSLKHIMHPPVFIPETKYVSELLEDFKQNKNQIAIIIDEYGGTAGIVTVEDILEEIVGEIHDEYDTVADEPQYTFNEDGVLVTDARVAIDQINELLNISISEEEDYDTIGGYITSELGRIPKPEEVIDLPEVTVQILEANDRKISKIKLSKVKVEDMKNEVSA